MGTDGTEGFQVSGFRFQVSGFKFQVSSFRSQVSSFGLARPVSTFPACPGFPDFRFS
jgi:hypothetical protein